MRAWWKSFHLSCNNCYCSKPRQSLSIALRIKQCHRCCCRALESETYRLLPLCTMASSSTHQLRTFSTPNWSTIVWTWLTLSTTCQSFPNCRPFKATTQLRNLYCFIPKIPKATSEKATSINRVGVSQSTYCFQRTCKTSPQKCLRRLLRYKRVFFFFYDLFFESIRR